MKINALFLVAMLGFGFSFMPAVYAENNDGEAPEEKVIEEKSVSEKQKAPLSESFDEKESEDDEKTTENPDEKDGETDNFDDVELEIIKVEKDVEDTDMNAEDESTEEEPEIETPEEKENNGTDNSENENVEEEKDKEKNEEKEGDDEKEIVADKDDEKENEDVEEISEEEKENEEKEEEIDTEEKNKEETDDAYEEKTDIEEDKSTEDDAKEEKGSYDETTSKDYDEIYKKIEGLFVEQIENYKQSLLEKEKTIEGFEEIITNLEKENEEKETISKEQALKEVMEKCFEMDGGGIFCPGRSLSVYDDKRSEAGGLVKVFSVKSEKGNYEIYFQANSRVVQITENERDDVSPKWDAENNLIVWQGQADGRWRIFVHERNTGRSYPLKNGGLNDINPEIHAGTIVWQGWIDGRWEIFSAQKKDGEWKTERITDNGGHDINPSVAAGIITWQSQKSTGWQVLGHNTLTGETFEVSQSVGKNKNPRVAIIWESEEGGSISTLAYSLDSGLVTAVSLPREKNNEFPEIPALPTKEQEAVVSTSTSTSRDKEEGEEI